MCKAEECWPGSRVPVGFEVRKKSPVWIFHFYHTLSSLGRNFPFHFPPVLGAGEMIALYFVFSFLFVFVFFVEMHIVNVKSLLFPYLFHLNIMHFVGLTDDLSQCSNTTVLWKHEPIDQICFPGFFLKWLLPSGSWPLVPTPNGTFFCLTLGVYHALTPVGKWWWKEAYHALTPMGTDHEKRLYQPRTAASGHHQVLKGQPRALCQPEDAVFSPAMLTTPFPCLDFAKCPDRFVLPFCCTQFQFLCLN